MDKVIKKLIKDTNARSMGRGWYMTNCPFHKDEHPSLAFNRERFICFSCGKKGRPEELADSLFSDHLQRS